MPQRRALSRHIRVIRFVWIAGFLVGTTTHVVDLALAGADVYADHAAALRLFWVSLTLLDPVVAVLIALRVRAGIVLGALVMIADVSVNVTVFAPARDYGGLVTQVPFGVFVLLTVWPLWRSFSSPTRAAHPRAPDRTTG